MRAPRGKLQARRLAKLHVLLCPYVAESSDRTGGVRSVCFFFFALGNAAHLGIFALGQIYFKFRLHVKGQAHGQKIDIQANRISNVAPIFALRGKYLPNKANSWHAFGIYLPLKGLLLTLAFRSLELRILKQICH